MGKSHDLATLSDDGISNLKVDTIKSTNGTTAMTVDSSGRVLRSVLPAWRIGLTNSQTETTVAIHKVEFDTTSSKNCYLQGGVTHNSGTITVPVAGIYKLGAQVRVDNVTGSYYIVCRITKNQDTSSINSSYVIVDDHGASYHTMISNDQFQCQANDELEVTIYAQADTNYTMLGGYCLFSGHLVG